MFVASAEEILRYAQQTVATFPAPIAHHARAVLIQVLDLPATDLLRDLGLSDPLELTGLYEGIPLTEKSVSDPAPMPDIVTLFRYPILAELTDRPGVSLKQLVGHITVHEFAHHFGWSDADIAKIDPWWL